MKRIFEENEEIIELEYDEEKVLELAKEVARECSVRMNRSCEEFARYENDLKLIRDMNNLSIYENIKDLKIVQYGPGYGNKKYRFYANKLVNPYLAIFLMNLVNGGTNMKDYDLYCKRIDLTRKEEYLSLMNRVDKDINKISNYETEREIYMIKYLERLNNNFKKIPDFDLKLLSYYYDKADELINVKIYNKEKGYKKELKKI